MGKLIYAKVSDERDRRFQIITKIAKASDEFVVSKCNLYPEGKEHINNMKANESKLQAVFRDVAHIAEATLKDGCVEFEYIQGVRLEERLSEICDDGDLDDVIKALEEYYMLIRAMKADGSFSVCDEFRRVFGDVELPDNLEKGDLVDIDLLPSNIMDNNGTISIIDYEWVFDFPIPLEYVFFKGLFSLMHFAKMDDEKREKVYDHFGLSEEKRKIYLDMEIAFQKYVSGDSKTLRDYSAVVPFESVDIVFYEAELRNRTAERDALKTANESLLAEIDNIKNSKSWRILRSLGIVKG